MDYGDSALNSLPAGRLAQVVGSPIADRTFVYDGLEAIAEHGSGGALQGRYVFGPGIDEPLVAYDSAGARRFLHADERGSIVAHSDAAGNLATINAYDEFGIPAAANSGRFGYTGQMWLPEIGLYHYKARAYAPHLGRFLQPDPIGYAGGANLYAYVGNDPINFTDPLGLTGVVCKVVRVSVHDSGWVPRTVCTPADSSRESIRPPTGPNGGPGRRTSRLPPPRPAIAKLSPCMRDFLASQGLGDPILDDITFHRGAQGSGIAKVALALGYPAITLGNNIYVESAAWDRGQFAPGRVGFFEEIAHVFQWSRSGGVNFVSSWAGGSLGGWLLTGNPHDSPVELDAILTARRLEAANSCPQ